MQRPDKKFSFTWRGKNFVLDINPDGKLKELGDELHRLTNIKPDTMRLIVPTNKGSKLFYPFSDDHSQLPLEAANIREVCSSHLNFYFLHFNFKLEYFFIFRKIGCRI